MTKPLVSIIMPAYNAADFISQSIESVLAQTYPLWELIIVDDGSTDNTAEVVQPFIKADERIRYIRQDNGGQGKARNCAIEASKGTFIAFLDADDLWVAHKLQVQVEELQTKPDIDLVFGSAIAFKESITNKVGDLNANNTQTYGGIAAFKQFISGNKIPILTVLVRKKAIVAVNAFEESRHLQNVEDSHLWLKLLLNNCQLKSYDAVLAYYRIHQQQSTSNIFRNRLKEINLILAFTGGDKALDKAILRQAKLKYRKLFIKGWSAREKRELFHHYKARFRLVDGFLLSIALQNLSKRLFSLYFRYIHVALPIFLKTNAAGK